MRPGKNLAFKMNFKCDAEQLHFSVDVGVLSKLIAGCLGCVFVILDLQQ